MKFFRINFQFIIFLIRTLNELLIVHYNDPELPLEPLSRNLIGIVDAAVMGGVLKYEQAFFTPEYLLNHKEEQQLIEELKNLIASQIPLLDIGIKLHGHRESLSSCDLQCHLVKCFRKLKKHTEKNYGEKVNAVNELSIKRYKLHRINKFSTHQFLGLPYIQK